MLRIVCYRLQPAQSVQTRRAPLIRELSLPAGAQPISAGYHNGAIGLWVGVPVRDSDPADEPTYEPRKFLIAPVGDVYNPDRHRHLGVAVSPNASFVNHVFEVLDADQEGSA